jgi:hypothetical protein
MTARARQRRVALRHWLNFAMGLAIGVVVWTPVLAATELIPSAWSARLAHGDWSTFVLTASVILLGAGLLLRFRARDRAAPPVTEPEDAIGRYRPQITRP